VLEALARTLSNLHSVEHVQDDEFSLNGENSLPTKAYVWICNICFPR
jgi:hypothetical protein